MRTSLLVALGWFTWALPARGQLGTIEGAVVDSATRAPLSGVRVTALRANDSVVATGVTDGRGRFRLRGLAATSYTLILRRVGYGLRSVEGVVPEVSGTPLEISLAPRGVVLHPVQVTASRTPETALDAPTSISVVNRRQIVEATAFTPVDYVRTVPGMDFASKGLIQHTFTVRGLRPVAQGGMLMLTDDRRAALPAIGFNVPYLLPLTSEDLERIEVVRGPGAALYGPGANRGVLHFVSRSPFESQGGAFSLAAGERDLLQATARFAAVVSPRLAFKISGDWLQGHDWEYRDSAEVSNRSKAIQQGADPDTLLIGLRDFRLRRAAGEARLDWRPDNATTVIASVGAAEAIRVIDVTGQVGGLQNRNWRYSFAQAKLHRGRLFANVTYNLNDAGDTYQLRTGLPLVDNSRQTTAQLQHGADAGRVALLYGLDGRWTDPRTGGTIHGRNEDDDLVAEAGGYVQARAVTSPRLDLVAAVRVDRNNRLNDLVVSPRAAAVFKPAPGHALRLTYNRAFSAPDASALFLDIMLAPGLPYNVRQVAIPRDGFSFRRDCGGICMRSPYNPRGQQEYLLADATLLWDTIRARFALSDVPPPNASQVATQLAALNPANLRSYLPLAPAEILDVAPPRRAIFQTVELGYDGTLAGRVLIAVDAYVNEVKDPMGPRVTATPNVFYDSTTLAAYLSSFRRDSAAQLAGKIAKIPVGTISPQEATDPIDILLVQSQGGAYTLWGADASLTAAIASRIELTGTYSWVSRNIVPGIPTAGTIVLSVPRTKGAVTVRYRDEQTRLTAALEARAVGGFLARSGFIRGEIEPYAVLDAHVGYRLPPTARITLSVDAYNLLDHRHREFAGAPEIGRLVVSRVQVRL